MPEIHGHCAAGFEPVRDQFACNLDNGRELGASVAVVRDGELVVDLWGGEADSDGTPWGRDTITNVWSSTKPMTALCALLLADRGELDLNAPVASCWPEFAAAGKHGVLVRHVLGHTSGLAGWSAPMRPEDLYDWDRATSLLAAQAPWWEPGTASGYHGLTFGFLVGEIVRRVTGVTIGAFFEKEIAAPLGADFHIGLDRGDFHRVSPVVAPPAQATEIDPQSITARVLDNPRPSAEQTWTAEWRSAEIPAANGHGNARSMAIVQGMLASGGELGGARVLSEAGCARALEEQSNGVDLVVGVPIRFGLGYGLNSASFPISPNERTCFWAGMGGSLVLADLDARLAIAYAMNRMAPNAGALGDQRGASLVMATYSAMSSAG